MTQASEPKSKHPNRARVWMFRALMHMSGITAIALISVYLIGGSSQMMFMASSADRAMFLEQNWSYLVMHVGLAATFWGIVCLGARMVWNRRHQRETRVIKKARGTIMTETLIMLVPFMLLTSGLAQLTINNIAGIMTHLAAYQAGRAAWLWGSESGSSRSGGFSLENKVRVAAAAAVAPVAPGSVMFTPANDEEINQLANVMFAQFTPGGIGAFAGSVARTAVIAANLGDATTSRDYTFTKALDAHPFALRAAKKLYFAYGAVEIESPSAGGATVTYHHLNVFPWFGYIFGNFATKNNHPGYYSPIRRTYRLTAQVSPQ